MRYFDAHNHLQDRRFEAQRSQLLSEISAAMISGAVVNGTKESDWELVAQLASENSWITPSFGLHPWFVGERSDNWIQQLAACLDENPNAAIGEVGLDRWIRGHDLDAQVQVLTAQLELAATRNRPVTIHCLKAWGALRELFQSRSILPRGFLLHAYSGPSEMVAGFLKQGAYFSFSTYFLHDRKAAQRDLFRQIPLDRILVETDAPDMPPPSERSLQIMEYPEDGSPMNHPVNLLVAYEELARVREMELSELAECVENNFFRLFGR